MRYFILFTLISNLLFQNDRNNLAGKYYSESNKFEKWSEMELTKDGHFIYSYGLSACQGKVTGMYSINKNRITFKNNEEFITKSNSAEFRPIYPDLSLCEWKIKSKSIEPLRKIDCGCFAEKSLYIKK